MASEIQWIPLHELVPEPERLPAQSCSTINQTSGPSYPSPLVIVTPDRRLIAGRAYLKTCRITSPVLMPCRVVAPEDLDITMTILHNQILCHQFEPEEFSLHLDLYAELCEYRQIRRAEELSV